MGEKKGLMLIIGGPNSEPDGDEGSGPHRIGHYNDSAESAAADQQRKDMIRAVGTKIRSALASDDDLMLGHAVLQAVAVSGALGDEEE